MEAELRFEGSRNYFLRFQWTDVQHELRNRQSTYHEGLPQKVIAGIDTINGTRKKNQYYCQTVDLLCYSRRVQLQADLVTMQSDKVAVELRHQLRESAELLFEIGDAISVLDMACSFAQLSAAQNYVRPTVSETLVLQAVRHPVMELRKNNFVANDVYAGQHGNRFEIVTGSNMSGKSTFIKSIALIQILAQMGCFVPARFASVPLCDKLLTRLSTEDKPDRNLGTFAVEMEEMNMILR